MNLLLVSDFNEMVKVLQFVPQIFGRTGFQCFSISWESICTS